jgi:hypothetical protein
VPYGEKFVRDSHAPLVDSCLHALLALLDYAPAATPQEVAAAAGGGGGGGARCCC